MRPPPVDAPTRAKAHGAVNRALRAGELVKPDNCQKCGAHKSRWSKHRGIYGHHEDYDKPTEVVWLCPLCHAARHQQLDAERGVKQWGNPRIR